MILFVILVHSLLSFFLIGGQEHFQSIYRELNQCKTGNRVESITGNQRNKATFTLLPLQDTGELDIVREISFVGYKKGTVWRAEVTSSLLLLLLLL